MDGHCSGSYKAKRVHQAVVLSLSPSQRTCTQSMGSNVTSWRKHPGSKWMGWRPERRYKKSMDIWLRLIFLMLVGQWGLSLGTSQGAVMWPPRSGCPKQEESSLRGRSSARGYRTSSTSLGGTDFPTPFLLVSFLSWLGRASVRKKAAGFRPRACSAVECLSAPPRTKVPCLRRFLVPWQLGCRWKLAVDKDGDYSSWAFQNLYVK